MSATDIDFFDKIQLPFRLDERLIGTSAILFGAPFHLFNVQLHLSGDRAQGFSLPGSLLSDRLQLFTLYEHLFGTNMHLHNLQIQLSGARLQLADVRVHLLGA